MLAHPLVLYFVHWRLAFYYFAIYLVSHWLIAIGLTGRINTNFHRAGGASLQMALLRHGAALGLCTGLAFVFYHHYNDFSLFSGANYKAILSAVAPEWAGVVGLIMGAFLAEQLLHYYCDRCLFRFRDPDVRRAVAPLL